MLEVNDMYDNARRSFYLESEWSWWMPYWGKSFKAAVNLQRHRKQIFLLILSIQSGGALKKVFCQLKLRSICQPERLINKDLIDSQRHTDKHFPVAVETSARIGRRDQPQFVRSTIRGVLCKQRRSHARRVDVYLPIMFRFRRYRVIAPREKSGTRGDKLISIRIRLSFIKEDNEKRRRRHAETSKVYLSKQFSGASPQPRIRWENPNLSDVTATIEMSTINFIKQLA